MNTTRLRHQGARLAGALGWLVLPACAEPESVQPSQTIQALELTETANEAQQDGSTQRDVSAGKKAFQRVLPGVTNQRACATCHALEAGLTLRPEEVATRSSQDPLFNAIDADDPNAQPLTFNNLRAGLVRVTLTLPENVDLIAIPPAASIFTPPAVSSQILAQWQASIVPGARLGDPMPPDLDLGNGVVIHYQPEIITPVDRKISVWRGVPSSLNTRYTAPYQFEGRERTLEDQAFSALVAHGGLSDTPSARRDVRRELTQLAAFQQSLFSDDERAPYVARQIEKLERYVDDDAAAISQDPKSEGVRCYGKAPKRPRVVVRKPCCDPAHPSRSCLSQIADPEVVFRDSLIADMSEAQRTSFDAGKLVYDQACAGCHGSATDNRITDRAIHDGFFLDLDHNGNLIFDTVDLGDGRSVQRVRNVARPDSEFLNIGTAALSHVGQLAAAALPLFNNQNGVKLPRYRLRFYRKAGDGVAPRSIQEVDLPPLPLVSGGAPFTPALDPNKPGALIVGPAFAPQLFSTDPGRALISGDWAEFEAFDVPQLRGIATTAPYFHDNSQADLPSLITTYSRFILPFVTQLDAFFPPTRPGIDRLTPQQKADLLTFLEVF